MDANKEYMSKIASNEYKAKTKSTIKTNFKSGGKKKRTQRRKNLTLKRRKVR